MGREQQCNAHVLLAAEAECLATLGKGWRQVVSSVGAAAGAEQPTNSPGLGEFAIGADTSTAAGSATGSPGGRSQASGQNRSSYAAAIRERGLHRRQWKLVVTGAAFNNDDVD